MPNGSAVCIGDFAVVHRASDTVRVLNIFGGVQVIHCTIQLGVSVGLTAGHGITIGITATNIAHSIQINLADGDFSQRTIILHDAGYRGHSVRIFVGCGSRVISVVGTTCVLILDFCGRLLVGLVDGHPIERRVGGQWVVVVFEDAIVLGALPVHDFDHPMDDE